MLDAARRCRGPAIHGLSLSLAALLTVWTPGTALADARAMADAKGTIDARGGVNAGAMPVPYGLIESSIRSSPMRSTTTRFGAGRSVPAPRPRAARGERAAARLGGGAATLAPFGHVKFCLTSPDQCRATTGTGLASEGVLRTVNDWVNAAMRARPDRGDTWSMGDRLGDCEDFALTKRARLIEAGVPAGALRLAVARLRSGEHHVVLVARTARGDRVLDNLTSEMRDWSDAPYRWLKITSSADPRSWREARRVVTSTGMASIEPTERAMAERS